MTRVIGGAARGRRLKAPAGSRTRPTSDRVREALFSSLEAELGGLEGLRFLDLYAGSGAVGLEALSRGAAAATLVEQDRRTAALVRDNARVVGLPGAEVLTGSVRAVLVTTPGTPYDVVFLDPPYSLADTDLTAALADLVTHRWLAPAAVVIVERSSRTEAPSWPPGLAATRSRRYGETVLWYGHATNRDP